MGPFNCYKCKQPTNRLIAPPGEYGKHNKAEGAKDSGVLYGPCCYAQRKYSNANLHSVVDKYQDTKTGKVKRITYGKAWEIENRTISKDDPTKTINRVTGREAQY